MKKYILCGILSICLLLSACGGKSELTLRANELLAVGDLVCTWPEAQMYILSQYNKYTSVYGRGIWNVEMAEGNFEGYIKAGLLDYLKLLFLADYGARKAELSLSSAEQNAVSRAADSFMKALGEEGSARSGITRAIAEEAYARFARAQIFYRQTMIDGQVEVSEEKARVIYVQIVELEQRVGYNQTREILKGLESGKTVSEMLRGLEGVSSRKENIARGMLPQELETIAFALKEGQWSPIISQGTSYYLIQSLSPYVLEETARHKAEMEQTAREENLNQVLKGLADSVELIYNPNRWNSWTMEQYSALPQVNFYDFCGELLK